MSDPYRDELEALEKRLQLLTEELSDIDRSAARRAKLASEADELRARLSAARARGPLDNLRVATPCNARWDDMIGDERIRFCGACKKDVYNVSGMTRAEATDLVSRNAGGSLCLRMVRRTDGTVLTADCPVGVKRRRVRRLAMVGAGVAAGMAGALWFWQSEAVVQGKVPMPEDHSTMGEAEMPEDHMMGKMAAPEQGTTAMPRVVESAPPASSAK